jgi:putative tryptophan/tyrosine transport system substrate-binding protein
MTRIAAGLAVWLCAAIPAFAQDIARLPLVGVLLINTAANNEPTATMLREALAALGDIDGKSIRLDFRLAEGDAGRLPELAAALVRDKPSVIVANGPPAVRAAQQATQTIPIVATVDDLVSSGFIDSMARPGSNITGISLLIPELEAKRLELAKEILPAELSGAIALLEAGGAEVVDVLSSTMLFSSHRELGTQLRVVARVARVDDLG